jgi:hypothetical protein
VWTGNEMIVWAAALAAAISMMAALQSGGE